MVKVIWYLLICFLILDFLQSTCYELLKKSLIVSIFCSLFKAHIDHKFSYNNCPHTNFMDNSLVQILNETTRVWRKGGKLFKNINAKSLLKI